MVERIGLCHEIKEKFEIQNVNLTIITMESLTKAQME